jgi:hypothetical protein
MTDFEPDGRAVPTGLKLALKCVHKVADLFVIDVQVAIASDAKLVAAISAQTRE